MRVKLKIIEILFPKEVYNDFVKIFNIGDKISLQVN